MTKFSIHGKDNHRKPSKSQGHATDLAGVSGRFALETAAPGPHVAECFKKVTIRRLPRKDRLFTVPK
jgi:hypothetical protein